MTEEHNAAIMAIQQYRKEVDEMNKDMQKYLEKAEVLIEALPYIQRFNRRIIVVKYGGSAMVDEALKAQVIQDVRYCLITQETVTSWSLNGVSIISFVPVILVFVVIVLAALFFRKRSRKFAEEV